jgi:O-antigen/teichoic acid export membrane protein
MQLSIVVLLPQSFRDFYARRAALAKTADNAVWLLLEHAGRLVVGLAVGVAVARHLGPADYGILSYALSITAFLHTFVYLGLNGIVVRDLVKHPDQTGLLMGSSFALKMFGACFAYAGIIGLALLGHAGQIEMWVLLITGGAVVVRPVEAIDSWFQSRTESKYSVLAKGAGFLAASLGRVVLVVAGASVIAFASLGLLEFVLGAVVLAVIYVSRGQTLRSWTIQGATMLGLLKESWVLILSGFLALVYLKIDQVMLRWMMETAEVGVYSVAVRFSEVWYFIPTAMVTSAFPRLVELRQTDLKRYDRRLQQGFDVLFILALVVAVLMTLLGRPVVEWLYGPAYSRAGSILAIHVWAGIFIFMRALFSKWVIMENALVLSLVSTAFGAIMNVILNLLLIRPYGGHGAAVATLISYAVASYLTLLVIPRTWTIAKMMTKSMLFPIRVLVYRKRIWA